jgi:hypothetical protein
MKKKSQTDQIGVSLNRDSLRHARRCEKKIPKKKKKNLVWFSLLMRGRKIEYN